MGNSRIGYGTQPIVSDGLVLLLDAANPKSYISGSTTVNDLSGYRNNGTLVNGVGYSSGNGGVFTFDGVNDTISIPYNAPMNVVSGITISAWIYNNVNSQRYYEILRKESSNILLFSFQEYGNILSFGTHTVNRYSELGLSININDYIGKWNYVTATYTSGYKAIYRNGILLGFVTTETGNLVQFNATHYIGSHNRSGEFFNGQIPIVQVYNRALSQDEVLQNYNSLKSRFGL